MIVVDASVAVKWTVEEDGHDEAMEILDRSDELIAPDLLLPESANVFRRKLKQKEIPEAQAVEAMLAVRFAIRSFLPSRDLIDDAWQIAQQLDHSVYDCVYLACALPRRRVGDGRRGLHQEVRVWRVRAFRLPAAECSRVVGPEVG